ncbi:MAG: hypothetical protein ACFB5Z_21050 [Elainellaceae cyanobacterium]
MTPTTVRKLWSLIDRAQASLPLDSDDGSLSDWLITRLRSEHVLSGQETVALDGYIRSRALLIRDLVRT